MCIRRGGGERRSSGESASSSGLDEEARGIPAGTSEQTPLLRKASSEGSGEATISTGLTTRLYISHFLSTWNSRVFEFGAVLYLATIFPGTLLPVSVYAIVRGIAAIALSPAVGHYVDTGNRLQVVRFSILFQRLVVAASCVVFYALLVGPPATWCSDTIGMFVLAILLACVEKLCSIMNMVAVEKDWVVVVAGGGQAGLATLNARMRRIDLVCKLLGPLFIALIDGYSTTLAITVNLAMNIASIVPEYFAIAQVYHRSTDLQEPKTAIVPPSGEAAPPPQARIASDFAFYFRHDAFLPSLATALLYLTVLSFAGQMVTYLSASGYTSAQIGIARTASVAFEVLATWVAPWLLGRIGPVRAGLWFSSWQLAMLVVSLVVFWTWESEPLVSAGGLVIGTILSRLGLRGFDLCAQIIIQEDVEAENRGRFSSVEAAWQNAFELLAYVSTVVFFRPEQFKWPSLISVLAVGCASALYTYYVYLQRGHLLHVPSCFDRKGKRAAREVAISRIASNNSF